MAVLIRRGSVQYGGGIDISNSLEREKAAQPEREAPSEPAVSYTEQLAQREKTLAEREAQIFAQQRELAELKERYIEQGKEVILDAKRRSEEIRAAAEQNAAQIIAEAEQSRDSVFIKARAEGFEQGRKDGMSAYLAEGKDTLDEARRINDEINLHRAELFEQYEAEIFDTVMEIANKVTLDSMSVKDGTVAKKLIKKAAKDFRTTQTVRITLDKNGASEELAADYEFLKELCGGAQHVEVELIADAEPGTVIVDNGSEIVDAGIQTQLKMIQELGSGKFKLPTGRKRKKLAEDAPEEEQKPARKRKSTEE